MGDVLTEHLLTKRQTLEMKIQGLKTVAFEQKRDLNEADRTSLETWIGELKDVDAQLDLTTRDVLMDAAIRDRIAQVNPDVAGVQNSYRSAGELLWDVLHQSDRDAAARYANVSRRAAQHMGTDAALTVPVAGGFGGLSVVPVTGPVIDVAPAGRPFLNAIGVQPTPSAFAFMRPRIVDPNLDTGVAPQALQKSELASQKFDIVADTLQLTTVGGYLNVSQQLLSFIPSSLDVIIAQLNKRLARATEKAALTELALSTSTVPLAADADASAILQAIYDASALVYEQTGELATWIALGPQGYARLGGLTDLAGRPLFPYLGATNALGTSSASAFPTTVAGLSVIVTPGITDDTFWVGNSLALEAYEYRYPVLEAVEPSLLGRQVAVASSIVFYRPTTDETTGSGNGAVHIAPAAP